MGLPVARIDRPAADADGRLVWFLNAYAVSPAGGSEPGLGFAWFRELASRHHVVLFTEAEFRAALEAWIAATPGVSCTVHFVDVGAAARRRCWDQGDWRFYSDYWRYQRVVAGAARRELAFRRPAVLHHLNMIGFREPGYFWRIARGAGVPLVWGPVGGYNLPPPLLYSAYGAGVVAKQLLKNLLNVATMVLPSVIGAWRTADVLMLAIPPQGRSLQRLLRRGTTFPETFVRPEALTLRRAERHSGVAPDAALRIAVLGKLVPRKLVDVAIDALDRLEPAELSGIRLEVIGDGPERAGLERRAAAGTRPESVVFHGAVAHDRALELLAACDVLAHCSVDEGTSHAVVEALAVGLPVIAFDCGGHSLIAASAGIRLIEPPRSRSAAVEAMSKAFAAALRSQLAGERRSLPLGFLHHWLPSARIDEVERLCRQALGERFTTTRSAR